MTSLSREATPELLQAFARYMDAANKAKEEALWDLIVASHDPGFDPALCHFIEGPGSLQTPHGRSIQIVPMYQGEAVGPTREVRLAW
jgi:hypothetical protein